MADGKGWEKQAFPPIKKKKPLKIACMKYQKKCVYYISCLDKIVSIGIYIYIYMQKIIIETVMYMSTYLT